VERDENKGRPTIYFMNDPYSESSTATTSDPVDEAARQAWDTTREKAGEALQTGQRYVRENPGTSVLGIFGFGFLLGLLVGWSLAHEEDDSYSARARKFARRWGH
jgi:hypothetical protein